jgi:hypothetical protein
MIVSKEKRRAKNENRAPLTHFTFLRNLEQMKTQEVWLRHLEQIEESRVLADAPEEIIGPVMAMRVRELGEWLQGLAEDSQSFRLFETIMRTETSGRLYQIEALAREDRSLNAMNHAT